MERKDGRCSVNMHIILMEMKHLPLWRKLEYIEKIKGKEISVCEDESKAYEYWRDNFNPNKDDCCNLKKSGIK